MTNIDYLSTFRMPKPVSIMGRSSSITNSFINAIIPVIQPSVADVEQALDILGMSYDTVQCAYCGAVHTEWDHLRPLVKDKRPTGYISEICNLVPACGKCNQSKGNKPWREWILSDAKLSPKTKGISDIDTRIKRLENYEKHKKPIRVDFEALVGSEKWSQHWKNWETVIQTMREAQNLANDINQTIKEEF